MCLRKMEGDGTDRACLEWVNDDRGSKLSLKALIVKVIGLTGVIGRDIYEVMVGVLLALVWHRAGRE